MEAFLRDLAYALRSLGKTKTFTAIALLTLALCTGANTAIFSLIHGVLLRPLPYPEPGRLVNLYNSYPGADVPKASASAPNYIDRKKATDIFADLALVNSTNFNLGEDGNPERIRGLEVTPSFFRALKVQPKLGRIFDEKEAEEGNNKVLILSHGLWQRRFASNPNILGTDLRLNGTPYRIVGVMPQGFRLVTASPHWSRDVRLWVPLSLRPEWLSDDRLHSNNFFMLGRLQPGVMLAQAQTRIDAINQAASERTPQFQELLKDARFGTKVVPLHDEVVEHIRETLLLLQGGVLFVLLIGCVNVANLLLARSNARLQELAVRFAMGAGRWRLARLLLIESVALGVVGGVLGLGFGVGGVHLIRTFATEQIPRGSNIQLDVPVLLFTFGIAALAGVLFGTVPLVHVLRRNLNDVFRHSGRTGTADRRALTTRAALVVAQVSLAFVLLIGAGLLIASFRLVISEDPGFRAERILTARLNLPRTRYKERPQVDEFVRRALEGIRTLPGVSGAAINSNLPFTNTPNNSVVRVEGYTLAPGEMPPVPSWNRVSANYFAVMGIPLLEGRAFDRDTADSTKVVIVDEFLARKYWPSGSPIGGRVNTGLDDDSDIYTVVGVVGSIKKNNLSGEELPGSLYFPYKQLTPWSMSLVVKTELEQSALIGALRAKILEIDKAQPLYDVKTMETRLDDSLTARRSILGFSLAFALLALLLSGIGIYGVLAYAVSQRTQEIGVRSALGAGAGDLIRMVAGYGVKLAGIGLAIGLAGAYALTRFMASLLYGVQPTDPMVFVAVSGVLAAVALLASVIPAVRAVRIQPMAALRYE
jgi:predicted permease